MGTEVQWSCGCHEVDGVLAQECTQVAPSGEISAERQATLKPYSAICSRKAASSKIGVVAPKQASGPRPFGQ